MEGFCSYYGFIGRVVGEKGDGFFLERFAELLNCVLIRTTRAYSMMINRLTDDDYFNDGIVWSLQTELFARLADHGAPNDFTWPLYSLERNALLQLDIPCFQARINSAQIVLPSGGLIDTGVPTGLERAKERLVHVTDESIDVQASIVEELINNIYAERSNEHYRYIVHAKLEQYGRVEVAEEAQNIANEITSAAIVYGRSASWIGFDWLGDSNVAQLKVLGPDLYDGAPGIAVFLAAHSASYMCGETRALALNALAPMRNSIGGERKSSMARLLGLGGGSGIGSLIYALTFVARILGEKGLLNDALQASLLFSDEVIQLDEHLDVLDGSAGGALALLALYKETAEPGVLLRAVKCGEHLLSHSRFRKMVLRNSIQSGREHPLTGFSHGAAGFAYALGALSVATNCERFARAAEECLSYEDLVFDTDKGNWPDFRGRTGPLWSNSWCHGSIGLGLGRLGLIKAKIADFDERMQLSRLTKDVRLALNKAFSEWPMETDIVCCGALGCIEFLREAAIVLQERELMELSHDHLKRLIYASRRVVDYKWYSGTRRFNVGFFRGIAGVGYSCLRDKNDSLPNVLLLE